MYWGYHEPASGWNATLLASGQRNSSIYSKTSQNVDPQASSENHGPPLIDPNLTSLLVHAPLLEALKFSAPALQPEADKKDGISDAVEWIAIRRHALPLTQFRF